MNFINDLIGSFILFFSIIYIWSKLLKRTINYKSLTFYSVWCSLSIFSIFNYFFVNKLINTIILLISMIICCKILFKENIKKTIIVCVYEQFLIMICEMIFVVLICTIFDVGSEAIVANQFGSLLSNISVAAISIIAIHISFVEWVYKFLILITNKIGKIQLTSISLMLILVAYMPSLLLYLKIDFKYLLIINTIVALFCFIIVIYTFKTKNNYIKISEKYNTTLNSLKEYEEILDKYRISNHENKNQLLTIRNLIPRNNKKIIAYIDTIIENKLKDNDKIMLETSKIPNGGLKGLMYSKVLLMNELKVNYRLEISKEVKTVDLINKIDDSTMLDICKVIGVYIDNSIQTVKELNKKYISIEMYLDKNNLIISISNNYEGKINESKIDSLGYTTKGGTHGYGLALAKDIITKNNSLDNERKISKDIFTQILKIKM